MGCTDPCNILLPSKRATCRWSSYERVACIHWHLHKLAPAVHMCVSPAVQASLSTLAVNPCYPQVTNPSLITSSTPGPAALLKRLLRSPAPILVSSVLLPPPRRRKAALHASPTYCVVSARLHQATLSPQIASGCPRPLHHERVIGAHCARTYVFREVCSLAL